MHWPISNRRVKCNSGRKTTRYVRGLCSWCSKKTLNPAVLSLSTTPVTVGRQLRSSAPRRGSRLQENDSARLTCFTGSTAGSTDGSSRASTDVCVSTVDSWTSGGGGRGGSRRTTGTGAGGGTLSTNIEVGGYSAPPYERVRHTTSATSATDHRECSVVTRQPENNEQRSYQPDETHGKYQGTTLRFFMDNRKRLAAARNAISNSRNLKYTLNRYADKERQRETEYNGKKT